MRDYYLISAHCANCDHNTQAAIRRGMTIAECLPNVACAQCGCKTLIARKNVATTASADDAGGAE